MSSHLIIVSGFPGAGLPYHYDAPPSETAISSQTCDTWDFIGYFVLHVLYLAGGFESDLATCQADGRCCLFGVFSRTAVWPSFSP